MVNWIDLRRDKEQISLRGLIFLFENKRKTTRIIDWSVNLRLFSLNIVKRKQQLHEETNWPRKWDTELSISTISCQEKTKTLPLITIVNEMIIQMQQFEKENFTFNRFVLTIQKKTNDPIKGNASSSSPHWFIKSSNAQKQPKNKTSHAQNLICCIRENRTNFPVQTENERNKSPSIFRLDTPDEWTPIPRKLLCLWAARPSHEKPVENMPYSFFRSSLHLFSFYSLYFRAVISLSPTHKSRSTDDFSCQSNFAVEAQWCFTAMQRKTTKMHSHDFLIGWLPRLSFSSAEKQVTSALSQ